jgi:MFS transporter, Spinster family, sphingosine-1-phosphate transporter
MAANGTPAESPGTSTITARLPGARLAVAMLLLVNLFNYLDRQVLAAVEPEIRGDLLAGDEYAEDKSGWLSTAFLVSYMLLAPLFGYLGDRMSRWFLIGVGVVVWSLASGASGLAATFALLLLTRCVVGVGEAAYGPVAPTIISDLYPVKDRGWVLSWFYVAIPVGSALGYALGSQVVAATHDWRWAFYLVVPPGLVLGILCFLMRNPTRGAADPGAVADIAPTAARTKPTIRERLRDYQTFLCSPSYVFNTLGMTAMTFALGGMAYWMKALLQNRNVRPLPINLIFTQFEVEPVFLFGVISAFAGLLATLSGGFAGDYFRRWISGSYFLVSGIAMLFAFPMILLFLYIPFPAAWVFLFIAVFCLFFNTGPTNTILANVTHPAVRASAFALNILFIHLLGDAISPPVIGRITGVVKRQEMASGIDAQTAELHGLNLAFIVVSVLVLIGGLLWLWGTRYLQRDTDLAPKRLA